MGATPTIGGMNIVLAGDAKSFSAALDQAEKRIASLQGKTKQFSHASVTSVQAASGALRELNGDFTNNIRAVERFITTIPGVGNALKFAFPLVGGLAFVAMVAEMGVKLADAAKKAQELQRKISDGFRDQHLATASATAELKLHNDELQNSINKLEGKRQNNLLIELDQNVVALDKMAKGAIEAQKRVKALIEENQVSQLSKWTGTPGTEEVAGSVNYVRRELATLAMDKSEAGREGNASKVASLQAQIDAKLVYYNNWLKDQIATRTGVVDQGVSGKNKYSLIHGDQTNNLNILRGERVALWDEADARKEGARTGPLENQKTQAENARAAAGQGNKAAELLLKAQEEQLAQLKLAHEVTLKEEYSFWDARRSLFTAGSAQYNQVVEKQASIAVQSARQAHETIKRFQAQQLSELKSDSMEAIRALNEGTKAREQAEKEDYRLQAVGRESSNEFNTQQAQKQAELVAQRAEEGVGRTMTRYAAAAQIAVAHQQVFAAQLAALGTKRDDVSGDRWLDKDEKARQLAAIEEKATALENERALQRNSDLTAQQGPMASKASVGAVEALQDFVAATKDAAGQMRDLVNTTLGGINRTLLEEMTTKSHQGPRHLWTELGRSTATSVASTALQKGEGALLSSIGLGGSKAPKGTSGDPIWTRSVESAPGGLLSGFTGGGAAAGGGSSGIMAQLGSAVLTALPFFADGVNNYSGGWAVTGERGPELAYHPPGTSIVPAGKTRSMLRGEDAAVHFHHTTNVYGNSDPAQVVAAVDYRMETYHAPRFVASALQASKDVNRRSTRRS